MMEGMGMGPTTAATAGMTTIDMVSDFVCPWCYIGMRNLDAALASGRAPVAWRWHPYFLNPGMPRGSDRNAYLIAKFGSIERARALGSTVEAAAREAGLVLDLSRVQHLPDTADAHRLMRWAAGAGVADAVARALFVAHFEAGDDIADHAVLVAIAESTGMDAALVADLLASDADVALVEDQAERARDAGITGVPSFVLNGKRLVVGAQPPAVLASVLAETAALQAQQAPSLAQQVSPPA